MAVDLEANKAVVRRLFEEGFNAGRLEVVDELVAPDVVTHNPIVLDAPTGPDSIRGGIAMIRRAFDDLHVDVQQVVAEGDRVASLVVMAGTNTGDYRRGGATGRRGEIRPSSYGASRTAASPRAGAWPTASPSCRTSESFRPTTSWPPVCRSRRHDRAAISRGFVQLTAI